MSESPSQLLSTARASNANAPTSVGIPESMPLAGSSVTPYGSLPDTTDQVMAPVPPDAVSVER